MLRALIRRSENGGWNDADRQSFYTVDFDAPALEAALTAGGYGPSNYEFHNLVGVEVLPPTASPIEDKGEESSANEGEGCDLCLHPLYAGIKCKNCGRLPANDKEQQR